MLLGNVSSKTLILVCTLTIAVVLWGCDGGTRITGVVFGTEGRPVSDAVVKLTCGGYARQVKTTTDGVFKIGMTHSPWNPELTLTVQKAGYKPFEKRFHASEHLKDIVVTLEPLAESSKLPQSPPSVPPECLIAKLERSSFPSLAGRSKSLPGESYRGSPIVRFQITEGGAVADAQITRSSGVGATDRALISAVSASKLRCTGEWETALRTSQNGLNNDGDCPANF